VYCVIVFILSSNSAITDNDVDVGNQNFTSPVSPAELLIALHGIDPTKVDVKTIIKGKHLVLPFASADSGSLHSRLWRLNLLCRLLKYTVGHKKRGILVLSISSPIIDHF